jgi:hypothetical protein
MEATKGIGTCNRLSRFALEALNPRRPIVLEKQYDRRVLMLHRSVDVPDRLPMLLVLCGCVFATFLLVLISTY